MHESPSANEQQVTHDPTLQTEVHTTGNANILTEALGYFTFTKAEDRKLDANASVSNFSHKWWPSKKSVRGESSLTVVAGR